MNRRTPVNQPLNVLFVCSRNKWRSPTAEQVYRKRAGVNAKSAGTSESAKRTITHVDIAWADIIFVMESKHKQKILAEFPGELKYKEIHVLDIEDEYQYMDSDLIEELTSAIDPILDRTWLDRQGRSANGSPGR